MKKEKAKIPEEKWVAHHISFFIDGVLIDKDIIHAEVNANLKRRIRVLKSILFRRGYRKKISYTIQQEEIK